MFGFSNSGFQEQTHTVDRKDWENVLDSLYRQAINGHKVGLALVSDTIRANPEDVKGTNPGELTFPLPREFLRPLAPASQVLYF